MNTATDADYVKNVARFGGSKRLTKEDGSRYNLSHADDFAATAVLTDGVGCVTDMPLLQGKSCFGRLERYVRGAISGKLWQDDDGDLQLSRTPCDTCAKLSPGVYDACGDVISERAESNANIKMAFDSWMDACGVNFGPVCFAGSRAKLWQAFLQAIIDHGGWSNVNDDQVKLAALRRRQAVAADRNAAAKARRHRDREARRGKTKTLTIDHLDAMKAERDRRAKHLRGLRGASGRTSRDMLWLKMLPDNSCDRVADVWEARELLGFGADKVTGKAIAERIIGNGRNVDFRLPSLTTRVHEALERLAMLEDERHGVALWPTWIHKELLKCAKFPQPL